jgi:hypothetical protein
VTDRATEFVRACRRLHYCGCEGQTLYVDQSIYDELYNELLKTDELLNAMTALWHGEPMKVAGILVAPHVELTPAWDPERWVTAFACS